MTTIIVTSASPIIAAITQANISVSVSVVDPIAQTNWDARYLQISNNLSDLANFGIARTNLGLVIGTDVQAYDGTLQSISSLGTAADKIIYTTNVDVWAETPITSFGRSLIDDASASDGRTTLDLIAGGIGDIWVEKAGDTMTGSLLISPSSNISLLTLTHPGSPTGTNAIVFNDAPGSNVGNIGYSQFAFSNISAQAAIVSGVGGKIYRRDNAAFVYGLSASAYLNDTTTGNRNAIGAYAEGLIYVGTNKNSASANAFNSLFGNQAAVTLSRAFGVQNLLNNTQVSGTISEVYYYQGNVNSNAGIISSMYGLRLGNIANANFVQGVVTSAYGVFINPISAVTNGYGIYINNISGAATNNYAIFTNAGLVSFGDQLKITGVADRIQLLLKANATQTTNPFELQTSAAGVNISFNNNGGAVFNEQGNTLGDFRVESDSYDAIFVDASNESIVIMSNAAGKIGFFGVTAIVRPLLATGAGATVDNVITNLQNLGLVRQV